MRISDWSSDVCSSDLVFAAYVSRHGHAFIDRALYLPKAWTGDPARMAGSHVPAGTTFATKPALAVQMIDRAIRACTTGPTSNSPISTPPDLRPCRLDEQPELRAIGRVAIPPKAPVHPPASPTPRTPGHTT